MITGKINRYSKKMQALCGKTYLENYCASDKNVN
jgi:hypothetical protein